LPMNYWWATQNSNYEEAIAAGTLWTCPRPNGRKLDNSRAFIKQLRPGDIVFHHKSRFLRAVSVVTEESQDWPRPAGYPARPDEENQGWLVRVRPLETGLKLHYERVAELIEYGRKDAPFHASARPDQRFLSSLTEEEGLRLLEELGIAVPAMDEGFMGRPDHYWDGQDTDSEALTKLRVEQRDLRQQLLNDRTAAECSTCGKLYPSRLLIAGHIKPRSRCSDQERRSFGTNAMLICSLGCDSLFEWGYILVNEAGVIQPGRQPETPAVKDEVAALVGRTCIAFNSETAVAFKQHVILHLDAIAEA
jgi:hypothetical protein